jgi:hypothetical protein
MLEHLDEERKGALFMGKPLAALSRDDLERAVVLLGKQAREAHTAYLRAFNRPKTLSSGAA